MKLLISNRPPFKLPGMEAQKQAWARFLSESETVRIATAYITTDSIMELSRIIEYNNSPYLELFIGMPYFELFTKAQYSAVCYLSKTLDTLSRGHVYLSPKVRFHGKLSSFCRNGECFGSILGSSNLGSLLGTSIDLYEADCVFENCSECNSVDLLVQRVIEGLGKEMSEVSVTEFNNNNNLLENHVGVLKAERNRYLDLNHDIKYEFFMKLKCTPQSNLNCFFGKGRPCPNGFTLARPWYEVEIIVPAEVSNSEGFPKGVRFTVITEDGWQFDCETNGDNSKNFRSSDDLTILGKWIKGTMEIEGVLTPGQFIDDNILDSFGKHYVRLASTNEPNTWLLSME